MPVKSSNISTFPNLRCAFEDVIWQVFKLRVEVFQRVTISVLKVKLIGLIIMHLGFGLVNLILGQIRLKTGCLLSETSNLGIISLCISFIIIFKINMVHLTDQKRNTSIYTDTCG